MVSLDVDWLKIALNGLQIGSILATAGFAAFGLLSRFKDDSGRLTRAGRVALAGIGLSALLSLTTQSVKAEVDRRAANAAAQAHQHELDAQLAQFEAQSEALTKLNRKQQDALTRTEKVLSDLGHVSTQVGRSIHSIELVGRQQDVHTARVLRTMWEDANRIVGERLELLVSTSCSRNQPSFNLFDNGTAMVSLLTPQQVDAIQSSPDGGIGVVEMVRALYSQRQDFTGSANSGGNFSRTRFSSFVSYFPNMISDPEVWRVNAVRIVLMAPFPEEHQSALPSERGMPTSVGATISAIRDVQNMETVPCAASVVLLANGRELIEASAPIEVIHDRDGTSLVALFDPALPNDEALPRFEAVSQAGRRR